MYQNIISRNCLSGFIDQKLGRKHNNPFAFSAIGFYSFLYLVKNYDKIKFSNITVFNGNDNIEEYTTKYCTENVKIDYLIFEKELTEDNLILIIDDCIFVRYKHYGKKYFLEHNIDIKKQKEWFVDLYKRRLRRMIDRPIFIMQLSNREGLGGMDLINMACTISSTNNLFLFTYDDEIKDVIRKNLSCRHNFIDKCFEKEEETDSIIEFLQQKYAEKKRRIDEIIIHCTATKRFENYTVDDIDTWHKENGFDKIGYHYVIYLNGTIAIGREENEEGAHCLGHNKNSIAVCYVGGLNADNTPCDTRTYEQKLSLFALIYNLLKKYPSASIHGHNEFSNKSCPCFDVEKEFSVFNKLFLMQDNVIEECFKIKCDVFYAKLLAKKSINDGVINSKNDIYNTAYFKKYKYGIKKIKTIFSKHSHEDLEIYDKYNLMSLDYDGYKIQSFILDFLCNVDRNKASVLLSILYIENRFLTIFPREEICNINNKNNKKYVNIIEAFSAWSIIKKTYPCSKTTNIINSLSKKEQLTKEDLIDYFSAVILLSCECETIKDYKYENVLNDIYGYTTKGLSCCYSNYVKNGYQINSANYHVLLISNDIATKINDYYNCIEGKSISNEVWHPSRPHTVLCCIVKKENNYIREWVEWYRNLGIDRIIICDNNDIDGEHLEEVIPDYIEWGYVIVENYRGKHSGGRYKRFDGNESIQVTAYNECYKKYKSNFEWFCFFDADEFLTIEDGVRDIHEFLSQEKFKNFNLIRICWKYYDDNGMITIKNGNYSLVNRFSLYNKSGDSFENSQTKAFIKSGLDITFDSPHLFNRLPENTIIACNSVGEVVPAGESFYTRNRVPFHKSAYLKHYRYKTISEYIEKCKKGWADDCENYGKNILTPKLFFRNNEKTQEKEDYIKSIIGNIAICTVTDDGYFKYTYSLLKSLIEKSYFYGDFICYTFNLQEQYENDLKKLYKNVVIKRINIDFFGDNTHYFNINPSNKRFDATILKFLLFKENKYDKILFLDSDIVVNKDCFSLFFNNGVYMRLDLAGDEYFNTGVMYFGGKEYFGDNMYDKLLTIAKDNYKKKMDVFYGIKIKNHICGMFPDQDYINIAFKDQINKLNDIYNYYNIVPFTEEEVSFNKDAVFIHYIRKYDNLVKDGKKDSEYCKLFEKYKYNGEIKIVEEQTKVNIEPVHKKTMVQTITKDTIDIKSTEIKTENFSFYRLPHKRKVIKRC